MEEEGHIQSIAVPTAAAEREEEADSAVAVPFPQRPW